jgi:hypothetical protein
VQSGKRLQLQKPARFCSRINSRKAARELAEESKKEVGRHQIEKKAAGDGHVTHKRTDSREKNVWVRTTERAASMHSRPHGHLTWPIIKSTHLRGTRARRKGTASTRIDNLEWLSFLLFAFSFATHLFFVFQ